MFGCACFIECVFWGVCVFVCMFFGCEYVFVCALFGVCDFWAYVLMGVNCPSTHISSGDLVEIEYVFLDACISCVCVFVYV